MGGIKGEGLDKERQWGRWRSEGEGEGGEVRRRAGGVRQRAAEALSDADRDTFAPELWNCVVWNWNGGASGAVICNKFQVLQHFEGAPLPFTIPTIPSPLYFAATSGYVLSFSYSFCPYFCLHPSLSLLDLEWPSGVTGDFLAIRQADWPGGSVQY